jgi:hypothetical protein
LTGGGYRSISGTQWQPHVAGILLYQWWNNSFTQGNVQNDPDGNADPPLKKIIRK